MWTPKRILLLIGGFVVFSVAYGVYAYFLGGVNGLPPLPQELATALAPGAIPEVKKEPTSLLDWKLKLAFGENCPELKRTIRLEVRSRGLIISADQFSIEEDGRVKLAPFSLALFGKDKGDGQFPEINTVQSDVAYLRFDQPISTVADMASHKIVGGQLERDPERRRGQNAGGVTIVNNRRSPRRDDDLTLTTPGPLFYEESRLTVWTAEATHIVDEQSRDQNNPTTIDAIGMDVYLVSDDEKPAAAPASGKPAAAATTTSKDAAKSKNVSITGVKAVALRSDVDMRLYVDSRSGFLGAPAKPGAKDPKAVSTPAAKAADDPAKKAKTTASKDLIHIKTQGPFHYDIITDRAQFDVSQHPGERPNSVEVVRRNGPGGACDQLDCEHLVLQFVRKNQPTGDPKAGAYRFDDTRNSDLEIETAHAWGNQVTLASDGECLTAFGNDLFYDARTRESTLKGTPEMVALKDGHEIRAPQLILTGVGEKDGQQANIQGPGTISMLDSTTKERTQQARFKTQLITGKEGAFDTLLLIGDASFEELEPGQQLQPGQAPKLRQRLQADRIKVWLEPPPPAEAKPAMPTTATATTPSPSSDGNRHKPHHLEAIGRVIAQSPEMNVHDTERLLVWFKDAVDPGARPAPSATAGAKPTTTGSDTQVANKPATPAGAAPVPGVPATGAKPGDKSGDPAAKPKRPIDLTARSVEAHVLRSGSRNELDKLWCEGNVRVIQAPETPDDKGTDIRGQTLQLTKFVEGSVLAVTGDLAEVQLDKLTILGPEVNIDQRENKAWVNGLGAMRMPSNANLQGGKLDKATELTVHWNRDMFFNGKYALFHGGVQAEQDNSRLACQTMQVFLDRFVSLKEGARQGPPAKVENLVCDKNVRVQDTQRVDGKLQRFQQIDSMELTFNNEDGIMIAPGPGILRILQMGTKDDNGPPAVNAAPAAPKPGAAPAEEELKLTRIQFLDRMFANNTTRTAVFYGGVEVVHMPSDDANLTIDLDKLPEGALYLKCDQLKVYTRQDADKKTYQQMEARNHAFVQSREFYGRADVIKFDETKELVVFEAHEGSLATLYRQKGKGGQQEELKGKKIYYWRKTNDFKIEGGTGAKVIQ